MLITFEGLDCSGKSTQARLLVERLEETLAGCSVIFLREPGGTEISEQIRKMLLDKKNLQINKITEVLLFSAARAQLVAEVIKPALLTGNVVVCDRFFDSTTAYQGWGRGIDLEGIRVLNFLAASGITPTLTFYLDIDEEEVERRKRLARAVEGETAAVKDRMESSGREFYRRVREGYLDLARTEPRRFFVFDGKDAIESLSLKIWNVVRPRLTLLHKVYTGE
jgi:dTMP kinase